MKKTLLVFAFIIILSLAICGCQQNDSQGSCVNPIGNNSSITDDVGNSVEDDNNDDKIIDNDDNDNEEPKNPSDMTDEEYFSDNNFTPTIRFAVASDVHIKESISNESTRLAKLFQFAYQYSDNSSAYNKLDAVAFAGDLAENGKNTEMQIAKNICDNNIREETTPIYVLGNHEFRTDSSTTIQRFTSIFDSQQNGHLIINGFHFIYVTADLSGMDYSDSTVQWLDNELQIASQTSGTNPIFVFHHHHVKDTVYLSSSWGLDTLKSTLERYPQVVDFSGHSHAPISDPTSIYQDKFTALGTGTLSYYEMGIAGVKDTGVFPSDKNGNYKSSASLKDAAEFYIVEVDGSGATKIVGYDLLNERVIATYYIKTPSDTTSFKYTENRYETSEQPYFNDTAGITISNVKEREFTLSFPIANCKDNVQHYRVGIYDGEELIKTEYILSDTFYYLPSTSFSRTYTIGSYNATCNVKVYAVSSFKKESSPITATVTMKTVPENTIISPNVFSVEFTDSGASNIVDGSTLSTSGNPVTQWNEDYGCYEGVFDGGSGFIYNKIKNSYDAMSTSVTLEYYGRIDEFPKSGYRNCFSNQEGGGIGFEFKSNGFFYVCVYINGSYREVGAYIEKGEYVYAVATYNGATVKLYINGKLKAYQSVTGYVGWTSINNAKNLVVGGDSNSNNGVANCFKGTVIKANMYSYVLSGKQINDWYIENVVNKALPKMSYCAYGDSITYGMDGNSIYGYPIENPYPSLVKTGLNLSNVTNRGVNGASLSANGYGFDCIASNVINDTEEYDIISVMGGVNDYTYSLDLGEDGDTTIATVYGALDTMARHLKSEHKDAFVFFITPYQATVNGKYCTIDNLDGYNLQAVVEAIKYTAEKYDYPVLDLYNEGQFEVIEMTTNDSDGLHPSQNFVTNYTAPQVAKFIKENIEI